LPDSIKKITDAESLFTFRTGLTLLISKNDFFDKEEGEEISFKKSPNSDNDIILVKKNESLLVCKVNPQHIKSSIEKNFVMFYETNKKGEVIRNTLCKYSDK